MKVKALWAINRLIKLPSLKQIRVLSLKTEKKTDLANSLRDVGPYLGLGLQLAVTIVIMVFIGDWLDTKYGHKYIFTLIFGVLGTGIGI